MSETRLSLFEQQIKKVLEQYTDPQGLEKKVLLATPYFLGEYVSQVRVASWGEMMKQAIHEAIIALWKDALPKNGDEAYRRWSKGELRGDCYLAWILGLNFLEEWLPSNYQPPLRQVVIYEDILNVSRPTYDRHLHSAIRRVSEELLRVVQPTTRLEHPLWKEPLIGRERVVQEIDDRLVKKQTVTLEGRGGTGKTTIGRYFYTHWNGRTFWHTVRPLMGNVLSNFLFAMANWLAQQGQIGLWQYLVVQKGVVEQLPLVIGLIKRDLAFVQAKTPVLLCCDEVDLLLPTTLDDELPDDYGKLHNLLELLRHEVALLLIGQRLVIESDFVYQLMAWSADDVSHWLAQRQIHHTDQNALELCRATEGNPRLIELCMAGWLPTESLTQWIARLPQNQGIRLTLQRIWPRLSADERALMQYLSVFRRELPIVALADQQEAVTQLINRRLVQSDSSQGVTLWPLLREVIYKELSAEKKTTFQKEAAQLRLVWGEYTAAAYHYVQAGMFADALDLWYPRMELELERGFGFEALSIFAQIPPQALTAQGSRLLSLMLAKLYQRCGKLDEGLSALDSADWEQNAPISAEALFVEGNLQCEKGNPTIALAKYQQSQTSALYWLSLCSSLTANIGRLLSDGREMEAAWREALRAKFNAEQLQGKVQEEWGKVEMARHHLEQALSIAEQLKDPILMGQIYTSLAILEARQGKIENPYRYFTLAIEQYQSIPNLFLVELVRVNMCGWYVQIEKWEEALTIGRSVLPYFQSIGNSYICAATYSSLAKAAFFSGDMVQTERYAQQLLRLEERSFLPTAFYWLAIIRMQQRSWDEADQIFSQAEEIATDNQDQYLLSYILKGRGECYCLQNRTEIGRTKLTAALELFQSLGIMSEIEKVNQLLVDFSLT